MDRMDSTDSVCLLSSEGEEFHGCKKLLSEHSDFFKALYNSGMKECQEKYINLPTLSSQGLQLALDFTRGQDPAQTMDSLAQGLQVSTYLQMAQLTETCSKALQGMLSCDNCFTVLDLAEGYMIQELEQVTLHFMTSKFDQTMCDWVIREARPEDCGQLLTLIKEMADYERLSHLVTMSEDQLRDDAFGTKAFFKCLVVELSTSSTPQCLIGYAVYFFTYSTFEGRSIYLEDLYVTGTYRSRGIGTALLRRVAQVGVDAGCKRLDFTALSWNTKAIKLYESHGAINVTKRDDWNLFRLEENALKSFAS